MNKDVKKLLRQVCQQGFRVRVNGSGHYRVTSPAGDTVTMSATPKAGGLAKTRADLKRLGAEL